MLSDIHKTYARRNYKKQIKRKHDIHDGGGQYIRRRPFYSLQNYFQSFYLKLLKHHIQ